ADLVRKRLLKKRKLGRRPGRQVAKGGIVVQAEVSDGSEELPVGLYFQKRADGDEPLNLRIVLENLFQIVVFARSDREIADDRRPIARTEGKREARDGIQRLENIALAVDDGGASGAMDMVLLHKAPGDEFLGLVVAVFSI